MDNKLKTTNLFKYATKELSQDAFICWLLSHATEDGWNEEPKLRECAIDFMNHILSAKNITWQENDRIEAIERQHKKIDVLLKFRKYYIIIEDKTFTKTHDDQINRYKQILIKEEIDENNIICVFYKIEEQPKPEDNVDYEFTREILLEIYRKYKNTITNPIFNDYLDYLEFIDKETKAYTYRPIDEWTRSTYIGLFSDLKATYLKDRSFGWDYVSNKSGGFMGLWWYDFYTCEELINMGLDNSVCTNLYLQIENSKIAVKYSMMDIKNADYQTIKGKRNQIRSCLINEFNIGFEKFTSAKGKAMTVGFLNYDESNYKEQLEKLSSAMLELKRYKFLNDTYTYIKGEN